MTKQNLVSIIIPTFNRADLIISTLESVKNQTYDNWECLIIDDNSTDATFDRVAKFTNNDSRFKFIKKASEFKSGASVSRNIGLTLSSGKFIQFLDSDDILAENKIEQQLNILLLNDKFSIVVCKWELFDDTIEEIKVFKQKSDYMSFEKPLDYFNLIGQHGGFYPPESFLVSKELINFSGYWNENITLNDDGEFFFRLLSNSKQIIFCDQTHVYHRRSKLNGDNLSLLNNKSKAKDLINSWRIIEAIFIAKFDNHNSSYINKKKEAVYNEIKKTYRNLISENIFFFKNQIKSDTFFIRLLKFYKRVLKRIKK